jgi:hypothetical protein
MIRHFRICKVRGTGSEVRGQRSEVSIARCVLPPHLRLQDPLIIGAPHKGSFQTIVGLSDIHERRDLELSTSTDTAVYLFGDAEYYITTGAWNFRILIKADFSQLHPNNTETTKRRKLSLSLPFLVFYLNYSYYSNYCSSEPRVSTSTELRAGRSC